MGLNILNAETTNIASESNLLWIVSTSLVTYLTCIVLALPKTLSVIEMSSDKKWNPPPCPKSDLSWDKTLFCSGIASTGYCDFIAGWIWLDFMLPFWKVLDKSDSTGKTSVSMCRAAIQSGDFNFFNSPSAVASSVSSLKHKSTDWVKIFMSSFYSLVKRQPLCLTCLLETLSNLFSTIHAQVNLLLVFLNLSVHREMLLGVSNCSDYIIDERDVIIYYQCNMIIHEGDYSK